MIQSVEIWIDALQRAAINPPPKQPVVRQMDLSKECPFKVVNKSYSGVFVQ